MTVSLQQAQADLAGLIHRLSPGDQLFITENDRTIAILTTVPEPPPGGFRPPPGLWKGAITILQDDDEHLKDFEEYMR